MVLKMAAARPRLSRLGAGLWHLPAGGPSELPSSQSASNGFFLVGDLNNDNKLDLIVTRNDGWQVLLNTCR